MPRPKFIADADFDNRVVAGLRRLEPAMDFMSATDAGLRGSSDPEVLRFSAASNRILVSHDRRTMIAYFGQFIAREDHPGLVIVRQRARVGVAIDALLRLWAESDAAEFRNRVRYPMLSRL